MKLTTTLALLRQHNACDRGYNLIANHVGQDFAGQIDLRTILEVNGQADCLWALRATEQAEGLQVAVAFAIYCAEPYFQDEAWRAWAARWMDGSDRSEKAASAAASAASAAAWAAAWAANEAWAAANEARAARADERTRQLAILRWMLGGREMIITTASNACPILPGHQVVLLGVLPRIPFVVPKTYCWGIYPLPPSQMDSSEEFANRADAFIEHLDAVVADMPHI